MRHLSAENLICILAQNPRKYPRSIVRTWKWWLWLKSGIIPRTINLFGLFWKFNGRSIAKITSVAPICCKNRPINNLIENVVVASSGWRSIARCRSYGHRYGTQIRHSVETRLPLLKIVVLDYCWTVWSNAIDALGLKFRPGFGLCKSWCITQGVKPFFLWWLHRETRNAPHDNTLKNYWNPRYY